MAEASNGVTTARWNTNPVHSVGFLDRDDGDRPFSDMLAAAAEYFAAQEADPHMDYRVKDVRYRMGNDGFWILEVDVMELSAHHCSDRNPCPRCWLKMAELSDPTVREFLGEELTERETDRRRAAGDGATV